MAGNFISRYRLQPLFLDGFTGSLTMVLICSLALMRLAKMEYGGTTSYFITLLVEKKYALSYRAVDAMVSHFMRFCEDSRAMPVIWHQYLLAFMQRVIMAQRNRREKSTAATAANALGEADKKATAAAAIGVFGSQTTLEIVPATAIPDGSTILDIGPDSLSSKLPLYAFQRFKNIESCDKKEPHFAFLDSLLEEDHVERGLFRYDVTACETKGIMGLLLNLTRVVTSRSVPLNFVWRNLQPFDGSKFNFTKVGQEEILLQFKSSDDGDVKFYPGALIDAEKNPSVVAINVSYSCSGFGSVTPICDGKCD
ncbi:mannose-1-phosphate guanylyltransferase [Artemisia annua]|uniref:Mannose-1-phosphate guanylyltransferase n=1 Tax=Artemisia annua TaxID=35608 RepID=A0A2U1QLR0_ARTAN|nr:mannose-1-phosphate guanylyltransferase [Artemisia annua]